MYVIHIHTLMPLVVVLRRARNVMYMHRDVQHGVDQLTYLAHYLAQHLTSPSL